MSGHYAFGTASSFAELSDKFSIQSAPMSRIPNAEKLDEWLGSASGNEGAPAVTHELVNLVFALRARATQLAGAEFRTDEYAELEAVSDLLALYEAFAEEQGLEGEGKSR